MKTAVINIKTDADIKSSAQKIAANMGLNLSTVLNGYLRQFIREEKVAFEPVYKMSAQLEKSLAKAEADYKAGRNISPTFYNAEDAISYLDEICK